jgi:hypothetical protein
MDPKPDKEFEKHGEIVLLYEIIANCHILARCMYFKPDYKASFGSF